MKNYSKLILLLFIFNVLVTSSHAQECIVLFPPDVPVIPNSSYGNVEILETFEPTFTRTVYIAAHIVRSASGSSGISSVNLNTAIQQLNNAYFPTKITFEINGIDFIDNDNYVNLTNTVFQQLVQIYVKPNKLNIYFVPQSATLNGIAYMQNNKCAVTNTAAINGSTLAHEVGHNLYLYHTHSDAVNPPNDCSPRTLLELVDGSNCTNAGDFLCDTPAEPFNCGSGILGHVNSSTCGYSGTFRDPNNVLYNPDTRNYMGYAPPNCRNKFSAQQIQKMNQTLSTSLSYLISVSIPLTNKIVGDNISHTQSEPSTLTALGIATVISGNSVNLLDGSTYQIRTDQERFPNYLTYSNIKHNNWNNQSSQFKLTESYFIDRTTSPFRDANFSSFLYSKIEAKLEGQLIPNTGAFQFQDPWYVLNDGSQPGNFWITCTSSYEPTGKEGATEKGVFLNQTPDPNNPNKPYYSVKAQATQNIYLSSTTKTHKFYFQNWIYDPNKISLQYPNALETGVVFKDADAVVTANLKGTELSDNTLGYTNNSQRKVFSYTKVFNQIEYPTFVTVYESMGKVFGESVFRDLDGITYSNLLYLTGNEFSSVGLSKSPAIDFSKPMNEDICFSYVYQEEVPGNPDVSVLRVYTRLIPGSASASIEDWDVILDEQIEVPLAYANQTLNPVIAMSNNDRITVAGKLIIIHQV